MVFNFFILCFNSWIHFLSTLKVAQSCPTLCGPVGCTVHGILQVRILEWVAFHFSRGSSQPRDPTQVSNPGLPHCRQILCQLSHKGSPRILEWVVYPQADLPDPRIELGLLHCRQILDQLTRTFCLFLTTASTLNSSDFPLTAILFSTMQWSIIVQQSNQIQPPLKG